MCGIAAFFFAAMPRPPEIWEEIRQVFTKNLLNNEERGRIATGAAIVQQDGTFDRFKLPIPASRFITRPEYQHILAQLSERTVCLLGHTREPTRGDPQRNVNNHPLIIEHHIGVHNGTITNDDGLFQEHGFPREGEVDSEIIFRLLNEIPPGTDAYACRLSARIAALRGTFATISIDLRDPLGLLVMKHKKPLSLHYHAPWEALVFSSRYVFLRRAFGRGVVTEALENGKLLYFHADRLHTHRHTPVEVCSFLDA